MVWFLGEQAPRANTKTARRAWFKGNVFMVFWIEGKKKQRYNNNLKFVCMYALVRVKIGLVKFR